MENHNFSWENSLQMVIFDSYVSLPEGIYTHISLKRLLRHRTTKQIQALRTFLTEAMEVEHLIQCDGFYRDNKKL